MRVFLDSSVLLAAAGSSKGASRLLFIEGPRQGWVLMTSDYCEREAAHNLGKLGQLAGHDWSTVIHPQLFIASTQLVLDRPLIYRAVKDRPVVISALSHQADWLLSLDRDDFHDLLGGKVYGMPISTPGEFLRYR